MIAVSDQIHSILSVPNAGKAVKKEGDQLSGDHGSNTGGLGNCKLLGTVTVGSFSYYVNVNPRGD